MPVNRHDAYRCGSALWLTKAQARTKLGLAWTHAFDVVFVDGVMIKNRYADVAPKVRAKRSTRDAR